MNATINKEYAATSAMITWLLLAFHTMCAAQTGVVYDVETHLPVGNAVVRINPKGTVFTDKYGRFSLPVGCHSVTFTRTGYESRSMRRDELCDTVWLMQKEHLLDAVVVTAKAPKISFDINGIVRRETASVGAKGGMSFNFFDMFNFRKNRHDKNREKLSKILRDY